ncbi:MAG: response regulator [Bacteroidota bacterium]
MEKTILLIEDNPEVRENTAEILELAGYDMLTAPHGKIGVQLAREKTPDLIVCDVMMPELDGYGVLRMLSRDPETARIPFVFLTAKADKADLRKGMNLGADDYLTKPFEELELLDVIETRLKKHESRGVAGKDMTPPSAETMQAFLDEARGAAALESLSAEAESRIYRTKDLLFRAGSYPRYLMYIASGKIKTFTTHEEDGKEYITGWFKPGDFLGYTALLKEDPYAESAMAIEEAEIFLVPKADFLALMYNNHDVSYRFIQLMARELEDRERELLHLAYDTVRKRVADALLHLKERYGSEEQETFKMAVTRDNLASMVGTSKECVIRVLSEFKGDKLVETRQSEIIIRDEAGLREIRW